MKDGIKRRVINWIIIPLVVWTLFFIFIFPHHEPDYSKIDFDEEYIDYYFGFLNFLRLGMMIGVFGSHIGILGLYIWYLERKEYKEENSEIIKKL